MNYSQVLAVFGEPTVETCVCSHQERCRLNLRGRAEPGPKTLRGLVTAKRTVQWGGHTLQRHPVPGHIQPGQVEGRVHSREAPGNWHWRTGVTWRECMLVGQHRHTQHRAAVSQWGRGSKWEVPTSGKVEGREKPAPKWRSQVPSLRWHHRTLENPFMKFYISLLT